MSLPNDNVAIRYFKPLEQTVFSSMEHAPSLKGFLKPFKGKGALNELFSQCEVLRDRLSDISREQVLQQVKSYPFGLLPIQLAQQTTGAGTAFLRWRTVDRSIMGVHLWDELIWSPNTSTHLIADLYAIEVQRIVLNMQISLLHSIARQARQCAEKVAHAQDVFDKRMK